MPRAARLLFLTAGITLIVAAFVANQGVLRSVVGDAAMEPVDVTGVRSSQRLLGLLGLVLIGASVAVQRVPWLAPWFSRPVVARLLLSGLVVVVPLVVVPLVVVELGLRPVAAHDQSFKTTLFMEDESLGWRLRPGAEGPWMGIQVHVNGKGLRGPEVEYAKPPGTRRILYLGDSVTFGFGIPDHNDVFPYLAGERMSVETVNAAVGGYSPWQEHAYLASEGFRYEPDLVVVCFVLNDVTEKFALQRFGGQGRGFQLEHSTENPRLWELWRTSGIGWGARALAARLRFGSDIQAGAAREELSRTQALVDQTDSPRVQEAWGLTLESLGKIVDNCRERDVRVAIAVFPYAWQLEDPEGNDAPQKRLIAFGREHSVPTLDLLPVVAASEGGCFIDDNHLSPRGHAIVAEALAGFLTDEGLLR